MFTCIQMSLWEVLDALGGASPAERTAMVETDAEGFTRVATTSEMPPGSKRRCYLGTEAVALFNVEGTFYAVSDRCSHGRASLSEGHIDAKSCILECPWHGGKFDVTTGAPAGGPPLTGIRTFRVKLENGDILVG